MIRNISFVMMICFAFVQCAGRFAMVESGQPRLEFSAPRGHGMTSNEMDQTHDENFKMPPEKKDSLSDKAGMTIVAIVAVGVAVASAIAIPLILANK